MPIIARARFAPGVNQHSSTDADRQQQSTGSDGFSLNEMKECLFWGGFNIASFLTLDGGSFLNLRAREMLLLPLCCSQKAVAVRKPVLLGLMSSFSI